MLAGNAPGAEWYGSELANPSAVSSRECFLPIIDGTDCRHHGLPEFFVGSSDNDVGASGMMH